MKIISYVIGNLFYPSYQKFFLLNYLNLALPLILYFLTALPFLYFLTFHLFLIFVNMMVNQEKYFLANFLH